MLRAMRFGYFLQLNGDSVQGQSTGRPEDGHKVLDPRKNEVTGCFWGWKGGSWSWWGLERSVVSAGKA